MLDPVLAIVPVGIGLVSTLLWARRQGKKAANLPLSRMGSAASQRDNPNYRKVLLNPGRVFRVIACTNEQRCGCAATRH